MATFRQRNGKWQAIIRRKGVKDTTRTFPTKALAEQWANDVESKAARGGMLDFTSLARTTVADVINEYRSAVSEHKKGWKWEADRFNAYLREDWVHLRLCDDISGALRQYRDRRLQTIKPQSFNRDLNLISAMFTWAMTEKGLPLEGNPASRVKRPKEGNTEREVTWTQAEIDLFLAHLGFDENKAPVTCADFVAWVFLIGRKTGMRRGEICAIEVERRVTDRATGALNCHVDLSVPCVHLPDTKNGESHMLPLNKDATVFLGRLLAHRAGQDKLIPFAADNITTHFINARKELVAQGHDVGHLRIHDTRHTFTTEAVPKIVANGGDQLHLLKITGRRTLKSLARYFNPKTQDLAKMLD